MSLFYLFIEFNIIFRHTYIGVEIDCIFSLGTFWMIPYEVISLLHSIRVRNKAILNLLVALLNVILFSYFIIWLDTKIKGILFSSQGLVVYIIFIIIFLIGIQKGGTVREK